MKNKIHYYSVIAVIIISAGAFFYVLYNSFYVSTSGLEVPQSDQIVPAHTIGVPPSRLKIPSLSINANVQHVGLTRSGLLNIPDNFTDVAWYKNGPVPGEIGNAIIDGHLDNAVSLPGVFKHLTNINIGDDIYVVNASGTESHFIVTKKESLNYKATSTDEIFGSAASSNLILITCDGTWDESVKEYSNRLIIFSTLMK